MHPATVVLEYRFWHKRYCFSITLGNILDDVFVPHILVAHLDQFLELHIYLCLSGCSYLVMVRLYLNTDLFHFGYHFTSQVVVSIGRAYREVAAFKARFISEVRLFESRRVPCTFNRIYLIHPGVLILLISNLIENEKLRFRPNIACIGYSGLFQICCTFSRDMSWVT